MKRSFVFLILSFISLSTFAQTYAEEIKSYQEKYKNEFLEDDRSPLKAEDLIYLQFFEPDESFRLTADFTRTEGAIPFDIPTMNGKTKKYIEYGKLKFNIYSRPLSLTIYQGMALLENPELKDYLFVPFTDSTNGEESYINGRYLDFRIGEIVDNKLIVDFNKSYNPYCAFSDGYNCPKPPEENALQISIKAGEKKFGKERH